jgi:hypothetical protein
MGGGGLMRSEAEIRADAIEGHTFSNGTEWEIWSDHWCWHPCKNDRNEDCPLIMLGLLGYRPKEWIDAADERVAHGRYECTEYEPDDEEDADELDLPAPTGPAVEIYGQVDIFEVFAEQVADAVREAVPAHA